MQKRAETAFTVHELVAERWSPVAFEDRLLRTEELGSLLEAARWAPSSFNEQPWAFLVARRDDPDDPGGFERMAACLVEGNAWARAAPTLVLSAARTRFARNDKPNRHALHDVGLATANLVLQAQALGLSVHAMAGFDAARARDALGIPKGWEPVAMLAVGRPGDPAALPAALAAREAAPRRRKRLDELAFGAGWGRSLPDLADAAGS